MRIFRDGGILGEIKGAKWLISGYNRGADALWGKVAKRIETYGKVKKQRKSKGK